MRHRASLLLLGAVFGDVLTASTAGSARAEGPPQEALTTDAAIVYARAHQPRVQARAASAQAGQAQVSVARAGYLPELGVSMRINVGSGNVLRGPWFHMMSIPAVSGPDVATASPGKTPIGVAVANAVLLITFARERKRQGDTPAEAAAAAARARLRPILMTSLAMIAGMIPMALGIGEGDEQSAPLGRAVIGGLLASTVATLVILPIVYALAERKGAYRSPSLDPDDPEVVERA